MISHSEENEYIEKFGPLVIYIAARFHPSGINDIDDFIQTGYIGLLKAIRSYNSEKSKFSTYAYACIVRELIREIKTKNQQTNNELFVDVEAELDESSIWELIPDSITKEEAKVLSMRLQGYTFREIGEKHRFSKQWAECVLKKAIEKIQECNVKT